jgi:prolyl-tRNA editing enzyme YbaK/EbsC (Cys-tRNA(Pro) deacylase)
VLDQIVKSILFKGAQAAGMYLFLTAGGNQVCPERATALADEPLERADIVLVRQVTGFAIGGVAPLGHLTPSPTFADPRLAEFDIVWAAGGTPRHLFAIDPAALVQATGARIAPFTA